MIDSIWQCDGLGYNPRSAAEEFARTYGGDSPRVIQWFRDNLFKFTDGYRVYRVSFQPGDEAFRALYKIYVENEETR